MSSGSEQQIHAIVEAQRALIRALHATSPSWLEMNLTMAQLKSLIVLNDEGPMSIGEVGCKLGVTLPTASYQVDRLVRAKLVERGEDPCDRRRTLVHLTSKAETLLHSLRQGRAGLLRAWLDQLSSDDLDALDRGMRALVAVAQNEHTDNRDISTSTRERVTNNHQG
jgi:MarR family transcriptional regulator, organic hydroperoxide resistance regulator